MTDTALRLTGVSKAFDKPVITDLDLAIAPGQLYALLEVISPKTPVPATATA